MTQAPPISAHGDQDSASSVRHEGTIIKVVTDRGFGFVRGDNARWRAFFHASGVVGRFDELHEGQRVSFVTQDDPNGKGPRATDVRLLDDDDADNTYDWDTAS